MPQPIEPLSIVIVGIMYFGDVVSAVSGALTAARHRMDVFGIVLIGILTGVGGGTLRDVILGHPTWWVKNPDELVICAVAAFAAYFFQRFHLEQKSTVIWADALGLSAFAVVGSHVAMKLEAPIVVAAFLGMVTAAGGGVIRDVLTQTRPLILSGQIYATAALVGATAYAVLARYAVTEEVAGIVAFAMAFAVRGMAILFDIRFGVSGEPIILMRRRQSP